jgi:L-fucose isomerase-like protein
MKIGYLPIVSKGGGVIGEVFEWKNTKKIIDDTVKLFNSLGHEPVYIGNEIGSPHDWSASEKAFTEQQVGALFVHNLNIAGGEALYKMIKSLEVPVIISAVPEPAELYKPPHTARYASYCGGQWNVNMCYLIDVKARFLFGLPGEKDFAGQLENTLKAIEAAKDLEDWKVCVIGDKTPGYYGAIYSEDGLIRKFGSSIMHLDFGMLKLLQDSIDEKRVRDFISASYRTESIDDSLPDENLVNTARAYLALEDFSRDNGVDSFTMKCVPETILVTGAAPCGINSLLTENGLISGCEGDVMSTMTMQVVSWLSGTRPVQVDIMSIREPEDSMLLWHCGAGAPSAAGKNKVTYTRSPILCDSNSNFQGVCVDYIPDFKDSNMSQLTEDWKKGTYRFFTADGDAVKTPHFIGGNGLRIRFDMKGEELGNFIVRHHLPHHFQITGSHLSDLIEEFCFWKDIELIKV